MNKILLIIIMIFNINNVIYCENEVSGSVYFAYSKEELLAEEKKLLSEVDSFNKIAYLGIINHFLGDKGEKTSQKAINYIDQALLLKPDSAILKAYLGSSYCILGSEQETVSKKLKYANEGIKILDDIYKQNKDNYEIIIILIYNCINLPDNIFNRLQIAVDITDKLLLKPDNLSKDQLAEILYLKSLTLIISLKTDEAKIILQKIITDYPENIYSKYAADKLKSLN